MVKETRIPRRTPLPKPMAAIVGVGRDVLLNALIGIVHRGADKLHPVIGRAAKPVTNHSLVEPEPPVNDLRLADRS